MTIAPGAGYRLRVDGHLDQHWSTWFAGLTVTHEDNGTTCLTAAVTDQAQLHGLLAKIRDIGVTLISVDVVDLATTEPASRSTPETLCGDLACRQRQSALIPVTGSRPANPTPEGVPEGSATGLG